MRLFGFDIDYRSYAVLVSYTEDKGWIADIREFTKWSSTVHVFSGFSNREDTVGPALDWIDKQIEKKYRTRR